VPRKTVTANVSLPPEIHAWVKAKIAAILEVEPAANPTFTSVVSEALRRAMNEELQRTANPMEEAKPQAEPAPLPLREKVRYEPSKRGGKTRKA